MLFVTLSLLVKPEAFGEFELCGQNFCPTWKTAAAGAALVWNAIRDQSVIVFWLRSRNRFYVDWRFGCEFVRRISIFICDIKNSNSMCIACYQFRFILDDAVHHGITNRISPNAGDYDTKIGICIRGDALDEI